MFYFLLPKRKSKKLSLLLIPVLSCCCLLSVAQSVDCKEGWLAALESKTLDSYPSEYRVDKTKTRCFTLPSNKEITYDFRFDTDYEYDIILLSDPSAKASGIEIRDRANRKIEFSKVYRKEESNVVIVTFEPSYNQDYKIMVKSIYGTMQSSCAELLVVMQEKKISGDEDEDEDDDQLKIRREHIRASSGGSSY